VKAGLETVPAVILDGALKPEEALEVRLVENLHPEGLDPLDEAETSLESQVQPHLPPPTFA